MKRRGSILGPLLLIAAGVVLLLNNLGLVPWTAWTFLVRLWPVFLIALGLDILFGRSVLRWAMGSAVALLVALAVLLALFGPSPVGPGERLGVPIGGAVQAEVVLRAPVGKVVVRPGGTPDLLVGGTVVAPWPDRAHWTSTRSHGTERFTLVLNRLYELPAVLWPERCLATVELPTSIPLALEATLGDGRATLDLTSLVLTRLIVRGGAGPVDLALPAQGGVAEVVSGTGEVTVRIPKGLGTRVRIEGCGPVDVPTDWEREGAFASSPEYGTSYQTVEVTVRALAGPVRIVTEGAP